MIGTNIFDKPISTLPAVDYTWKVLAKSFPWVKMAAISYKT